MNRPALLFSTTIIAASLYAVPLPKAADQPALNLEHYLEYRSENRLDLVCKASKTDFSCRASEQKFKTGENNNTADVSFKKAELFFNAAVSLVLGKETFNATLQEMKQAEEVRRQRLASKKPYLAPPATPLQDALDRTLFGNLEQINVEQLVAEEHDPRTRISVGNIHYENRMKRTMKGAAFSERIFGTVQLSYADATVVSEDPDTFYGSLPGMLERWFDTNDTVRSGYVGAKLRTLASEALAVPFGGTMRLNTEYLGNDRMSVHFDAQNRSKNGANDSFDFQGEVHSISSLFTPARMPRTPGTPDFLFRAMHSKTHLQMEPYRRLLSMDKRFAGYVGEYDALTRSFFDKKIKQYHYSSVLSGWFAQAKHAFSDILLGRKDTLSVSVRNKDGMTALQVFGILMGEMMLASPTTQSSPDEERIIADTAARHLDVGIEAR